MMTGAAIYAAPAPAQERSIIGSMLKFVFSLLSQGTASAVENVVSILDLVVTLTGTTIDSAVCNQIVTQIALQPGLCVLDASTIATLKVLCTNVNLDLSACKSTTSSP